MRKSPNFAEYTFHSSREFQDIGDKCRVYKANSLSDIPTPYKNGPSLFSVSFSLEPPFFLRTRSIDFTSYSLTYSRGPNSFSFP